MPQNRGQGLGFTIRGVVIDRRSLAKAAIKLYSGLSSAVTFLFAVVVEGAAKSATGVEECALTTLQTGIIKTALVSRGWKARVHRSS
eukprot:COSAG06_NODE_3288_length_5551_cov_25.524578_3_plen_87_part_00